MLPFYMDSQTRDALIAESNRLIALRAANAASSRNRARAADSSLPQPAEPSALDTDAADTEAANLEANSAFAALVSGLCSTSSERPQARAECDVAR